jgi:hypothetical protein
MSSTKREVMMTSDELYVSLAHGGYETSNIRPYVIPDNLYVVYVSKASRYLAQTVIDSDFYRYFGSVPLVKNSIRDARSWKPSVLDGMFQRVYGPGDVIANILLQYRDPEWPGMGIHRLPIQPNQLRVIPGDFHNRTMHISDVLSSTTYPTPTIVFFVNCRATTNTPSNYMRQNINYNFGGGTLENKLILQNIISSRMNKRRRGNNVNFMNINMNAMNVNRRRIRRIRNRMSIN